MILHLGIFFSLTLCENIVKLLCVYFMHQDINPKTCILSSSSFKCVLHYEHHTSLLLFTALKFSLNFKIFKVCIVCLIVAIICHVAMVCLFCSGRAETILLYYWTYNNWDILYLFISLPNISLYLYLQHFKSISKISKIYLTYISLFHTLSLCLSLFIIYISCTNLRNHTKHKHYINYKLFMT